MVPASKTTWGIGRQLSASSRRLKSMRKLKMNIKNLTSSSNIVYVSKCKQFLLNLVCLLILHYQ